MNGQPVPSSRLSGVNAGMDLPAIRRRDVIVALPQGLHMRPAAAFAKIARQYPGNVTVIRDDRRVNGKSQIDLLLLAAEPGVKLTLEVADANAETALDALENMLLTEVMDWGDGEGI
jgi:phosphotransferase system HPr (HPr) family protein